MLLPSRGGVSLRFSYLWATHEGMPLEKSKAYFPLFYIDSQHLPISYRTFSYKRSEFYGKDALSNRMRRDLTTRPLRYSSN